MPGDPFNIHNRSRDTEMSCKRNRSEADDLLYHEDDYIAFNAMNDTISGNDVDEAPGVIWFDDAKNSPPDAVRTDAKICNNSINNDEFVIDETIITKYFVAAIQSHNRHLKLDTEDSNLRPTNTMLELDSNNKNNDIDIVTNSWEPKELELPLWAVSAPQK
jgi:hypothetical protein